LSLFLLPAVLLAAGRPNILLICVDDLKPLLGCHGNRTVKAPHLDRLAARGMRFDRAYCNQAVCAPSRNSLLTGRRPQSLGIYDLGTNFRLAVPDAVTLPQFFIADEAVLGRVSIFTEEFILMFAEGGSRWAAG